MKTKAEHSVIIRDALLEVEARHRKTGKAIAELHVALAAAASDYPDELDGEVSTLATAPKP